MAGIQIDPPSLSDWQLDEILRITNVGQEHRDSVRCIINNALDALQRYQLWRRQRPPYSSDLMGLIKRVAQPSDDLQPALNELQRCDELPSWFLLFAGVGEGDYNLCLYALSERLKCLASACEIITEKSQKKKNAHRPRGTIKYPTLSRLIHELYIGIVKERGGKLTVWHKDGKCKGTLPAILVILRDVSPQTIPSLPSYSTLRWLLKDAELPPPTSCRITDLEPAPGYMAAASDARDRAG